MGRLRWQPPATRRWIGVSRFCQAATFGSGERPCSTKWNKPPERSTRRISLSARSTSGMLQSVQVVSTWSMLADSRDRSLPVEVDVLHRHAARRNPLGCKLAPDGRRVDRSDSGDRGRIVGDVQTRAESDLEHVAVERSGDASTDRRELAAAHDQVGEARNDLILIEPHPVSIVGFEASTAG
jgi:hypothetical protein